MQDTHTESPVVESPVTAIDAIPADAWQAVAREIAAMTPEQQTEVQSRLTREQMALVALAARDLSRDIIARAEAEAKPISTLYKDLSAFMLGTMNQSGEKSCSGAGWRATITSKAYVSLKDAEPFYAFVRENNRFDMLHRRISSTVVAEYKEATGEVPPGLSFERANELVFYKA